MAELPIAPFARIARKNGAERVSEDASKCLAEMAEEFVGQIVQEALKLAAHAGRKTIKSEDIKLAADNLKN